MKVTLRANKMRIGIVTVSFYPDKCGGIETYLFKLKQGLKERGHYVKVITPFWNRKIPDPDVIQVDIPKTGELKNYLIWTLKSIKFLKSMKLDIVHGHGLHGIISCLFSGKDYILTLHETTIREPEWYGSFRHKVGQYLLKKALEKSRKIIVPTNITKNYVINNIPNLNKEKINVIPYGVDLDKFKPEISGKEIKRRLGLEGKRIILYFGRVKPVKGILGILNAYRIVRRKTKNIKLVVAGAPSSPGFLTYLKKEYPEALFVGYVPEIDVPKYYAMADIYCIYSKPIVVEAFGLTIIEAMASGKPVVCSDLRVFREVTGENATFVEYNNSIELANALLTLLKMDKKALQEKGLKARNFVEKYSWSKTVKETEKVYLEVLSSKR